jgi:DNA-binding transcriptional MerR regulator
MLKQEIALTVGELARRIGCPVHRVEYLIRARNLQPIQRAGNARVFSEKDAAFVRDEIQRIGERGKDHE